MLQAIRDSGEGPRMDHAAKKRPLSIPSSGDLSYVLQSAKSHIESILPAEFEYVVKQVSDKYAVILLGDVLSLPSESSQLHGELVGFLPVAPSAFHFVLKLSEKLVVSLDCQKLVSLDKVAGFSDLLGCH